MKTNEKQKLQEKRIRELKDILAKLKNELINEKVVKATEKKKDIHASLKKRRKIAVIKTIIREKTLKEHHDVIKEKKNEKT